MTASLGLIHGLTSEEGQFALTKPQKPIVRINGSPEENRLPLEEQVGVSIANTWTSAARAQVPRLLQGREPAGNPRLEDY